MNKLAKIKGVDLMTIGRAVKVNLEMKSCQEAQTAAHDDHDGDHGDQGNKAPQLALS